MKKLIRFLEVLRFGLKAHDKAMHIYNYIHKLCVEVKRSVV